MSDIQSHLKHLSSIHIQFYVCKYTKYQKANKYKTRKMKKKGYSQDHNNNRDGTTLPGKKKEESTEV